MKIAVFFGGRSVEHEVSVVSGIQVCNALNLEHEIIPVYLDKNNRFFHNYNLLEKSFYTSPKFKKNEEYLLGAFDGKYYIRQAKFPFKKVYFDIAFLCVHGKGVEDGTLSSLFELLDIPYVGPSRLSGALSQSKKHTKQVLKNFNVDVVDYEIVNSNKIKDKTLKRIERLGFPLILKANNLGSSIGVEVVKDYQELLSACDYIFKYDDEVIIEKYIQNKKEYNIALFKHGDELILSEIEEILSKSVLSYEQKYLDEECQKIIPAKIKKALQKDIEYNAKKIYYALNCKNVVRLDFIYDEDEKVLYLNEVNSIPGSYAFYLFKEKFSFLELLNKVINNSLLDFEKKRRLIRTVNNDSIYLKEIGFKNK